MIGILSSNTELFLQVLAIFTVVAFAIPIFLAPLTWARVLRWDIDPNSDLALYFGRCLGVTALVLSWGAWHAASHPELQPFYLKMFIGTTALLSIIHIVGAVQKVQPWTETAEIPFWGGLAVLGLLFYPLG